MQRPDPVPVAQALQTILETGSRWHRGGLDPRTGAGCYGLIWWSFQQVHIELPPTAEEGEKDFVIIPPPYAPWDVVLCSMGPLQCERHLGLLLSPQGGYHCSAASNGAAQFRLHQAFWRRYAKHGLRYREFLACD